MKRKRARVLRSLTHDEEGVTAVEFALLGAPFFILLLAIAECGIAFAGQQALVHASERVSREIRTGSLRAADIQPARMHQEICNHIQMLVAKDCPELVIDLRELDSFADAAGLDISFTGAGSSRDIDTSGFQIQAGGSGAKQILRVFYRWPVYTELFRRLIAGVKGDRTLLYAGTVWQNEPFRD